MYNLKDNLTSSIKGLTYLRGGSVFNNNTKIIIYVVIVLIILLIIYYVYVKYVNPKLKEVYKPNKEQVSTSSSSGNASGNGSNTVELFIFTADWCPHCKAAKPEWDAIKAKYDNTELNGYMILFKDINCTTNSPNTDSLMDKYNVEGFPTVKMLKDGKIINFEAKITQSNLTQFITTTI